MTDYSPEGLTALVGNTAELPEPVAVATPDGLGVLSSESSTGVEPGVLIRRDRPNRRRVTQYRSPIFGFVAFSELEAVFRRGSLSWETGMKSE